MKNINELLTSVKKIFEEENFIFEPKGLYEPIDYTLRLGGKRIRPVMLMIANQMFGGDEKMVRHAVVGIETFHNFTLLHDDLMDKSPIRRGKPTVYTKWNENTAILSGDTMFAMAWRFFLQQPHEHLQEILTTFNETAIGVCNGQQYDMEFESRNDVSISEYIEMIRLKTAVLLAGALKIGAQYANAPAKDIDYLYDLGIHLGLAFQLQDDLLDAYGDVKTFGKQTGSDIRDNKKTYLLLRAYQLVTPAEKKRLSELFQTTPEDPSAKIAEVLKIYADNNIKTLVEEEIKKEFIIAQKDLEKISCEESLKQPLKDLMKMLFGRDK